MSEPSRASFVSAVAAASAACAFNGIRVDAAPSLEVCWYARRLSGDPYAFGDGARRRLAAASLIKLVIAYVLVCDAAAGRSAWEDALRVRERDVVDGSPTFANSAGRDASLGDLMFAMLSQSDNTAANALLGHVGFARCNAAAHTLRLAQTTVERRFYDWRAERRGFENYSSAHDVGELLVWFARTAATPSPARDGAARAMRALYAQEDRETIPAALPGRRIANKTGELPGYRHDAAIVGAGEARYALVVMTRFEGGRQVAIDAIREIARAVDARETAISRERDGMA